VNNTQSTLYVSWSENFANPFTNELWIKSIDETPDAGNRYIAELDGVGRMTVFSDDNESSLLRQSWERHDAERLDTYLVSGVEDPRINLQSILTRALLCDALFPGRFARLIDEELRFGFVMTWLFTWLQLGVDKRSVMTAIKGNDRSRCPGFVIDTFRTLQQEECVTKDYVTMALRESEDDGSDSFVSEAMDTFGKIWHERLSALSHNGCSLFEPACGSANDFRYLHSYGFTKFLKYTGIDIAPKNIGNALGRFPDVDFRVGDLLNNRFDDDSFDYSFVHDLFEHLSIAAMEHALRELLRVTRREVWLHLFNAADVSRHDVRPVATYHCNLLSIREIVRVIAEVPAHAEVVSIAELGRRKFGFSRYYNAGAHTIVAIRDALAAAASE
jgi:ubiquinone/menaquinone biosynthesis C-methylase UbiE